MITEKGEVALLSSTSFQVRIGDEIVNAVIKGKRLKGAPKVVSGAWDKKKALLDNSLCVGDLVDLEYESGSWKITGFRERLSSFVRYNFIKRKLQAIGANFDVLCIVASHCSPEMNSFFVNTALTGLDGKCGIAFVFSKSDLPFSEGDLAVIDSIRKSGFDAICLSSKSGDGISELRSMIEGRTAMFIGESGGGKSTLLNRIFGRDIQAVGDLSKKKSTGCHTTTSSVLLCDGPLKVIDTPGIRFVRPLLLARAQIEFCFPDLFGIGCKYADCTHMGEAGCNADAEAASGRVSSLRLNDYRRMMSADAFLS